MYLFSWGNWYLPYCIYTWIDFVTYFDYFSGQPDYGITNTSLDFTGRRKSPPPQRPSSPAAIIRIQSANHHHSTTRPSSALHVKVGSDWLAGGRDIFWENVQKRPRSGHVPGWKEGLPESMKRPRSAVANRTLRSGSSSVDHFSHKVHHGVNVTHLSLTMDTIVIKLGDFWWNGITYYWVWMVTKST